LKSAALEVIEDKVFRFLQENKENFAWWVKQNGVGFSLSALTFFWLMIVSVHWCSWLLFLSRLVYERFLLSYKR
jgi:hypothetical protein